LADYRDIRDRALTIIQQASNEEGERFFDLAEINNATPEPVGR
jgi:hypothetical protein